MKRLCNSQPKSKFCFISKHNKWRQKTATINGVMRHLLILVCVILGGLPMELGGMFFRE